MCTTWFDIGENKSKFLREMVQRVVPLLLSRQSTLTSFLKRRNVVAFFSLNGVFQQGTYAYPF